MKHWILLGALTAAIIIPGAARADGYNSYSWPGWRLSTEEGFNLETNSGKDSNVRNNRVAFPMTQLVDGDPDTAWVWDDAVWKTRRNAQTNSEPSPARSFNIESDNSVVADELWLMNGYNKREDLWKRNDRVVEIRIHLDHKPVKKVTLSDQMGWHKISLPRHAWKNLKIELTGIRKGGGKDNDICLSELALYSRGKKIDFGMPRAVIYQLSACCGGTGWLINRGGRVIATGGTGEGASLEWSPDGKRVAGISGQWDESARKQRTQIWIADAMRPAVIERVRISQEYPNLRWLSKRTLQVSVQVETKRRVTYKEVRRIYSPS